MSYLLSDGRFKAFDNAGDPLVGGKLYTYASGTTTDKATYTSSGLATPNTNPITLDSRGEAQVWLGPGAHTFVLKTITEVTIWTVDGVQREADAITDFQATLATAAGGAPNIGYKRPEGSAVATDVEERLQREVWIEDFLSAAQLADAMTGTPTLDSYTAVQAAIDAACPIVPSSYSAGRVMTNVKALKIGTRLNLTNSRVNGTRSRDGLSISGNNQYGTRILGETGSGNAVIETTGTQFLKLERLSICSGSTNKSSIGILQACGSVLQQTQNQAFYDCSVIMHSDATANGGLGTIALWNFGSEETNYHNFYTTSDRSVVLTSSNDGTQPGALTLQSYQSLLTTHSLGMTTFSGVTSLISAGNRYGPQLTVQNIGPCVFDNLYIGGAGTLGANTEAIQFLGDAVGFRSNGVIEGMSSILFTGSLINCDINVDWGGVYVTTEAALRVNRAVASGWYNVNIAVNLEASTSRPILSTTDGNETSASSYSIANSTIRARASGAPNLYMPLNVAKNVGTYNNRLLGANTQPSAAAFGAGLTADATNATGDGTAVVFNASGWTEDFDTATAFDASTGVFTAPLSGQYLFNAQFSLADLGSAHTALTAHVVVNGQKYLVAGLNPGAIRTATNTLIVSGTAIVKLTAGDPVYLQITVSNGTKVVDVQSGASGTDWRTRFEGRLIL
jgi:hypothetical protein